MNEKEQFLKNGFRELALRLDPEARGSWGKMNAQQMIEHLVDNLKVTNGKKNQKAELTPEQTAKVRSFFLSDKNFRENTTNHLLPDIPHPWEYPSMKSAIEALDKELEEFFTSFGNDPSRKTINPFAGEFGYEEWLHLLHKHFMHHARQFGLVS
jgi:hypothetical protein